MSSKYSDQFVDWLVEEGYTHCFFVAGGNIMHLLDSVRTKMTCIPFVNEIGAAIAAEYFTGLSENPKHKAFALVTAGPGLTNTVTAIASAWMESRELLVVGGQVKSSDLSNGEVRQRGIQEVEGIPIVDSICKKTLQISSPVSKQKVLETISAGATARKGPVFIEFCLDAQAALPISSEDTSSSQESGVDEHSIIDLNQTLDSLAHSSRPVFLLGGGLDRKTVRALDSQLSKLGIPILLTWNGGDLLSSTHPLYFGRPNTWGQRSANLILQQSDLLIAVGTRLGIQQTGFAWDEFLPVGKVIQVEIDPQELEKGHPQVDIAVNADGNLFLRELVNNFPTQASWKEWRDFAQLIKNELPLNESENVTGPGYVEPYSFLMRLPEVLGQNDQFIPSSSGSAFTVSMQSLQLRENQRILTNKGMASMGYGLSGAIGASLLNPDVRTILIEGDGSFAQNLQELGTVAANNLNLKILLFANDGYASIRMTQRNYFDGAWIGCDSSTGLGLPDWSTLAESFGIPYLKMEGKNPYSRELISVLDQPGPAFIEVPIDPEQTFFPKIMSQVQPDGSMKSNPLHLMSPPLEEKLASRLLKYISETLGKENE